MKFTAYREYFRITYRSGTRTCVWIVPGTLTYEICGKMNNDEDAINDLWSLMKVE